MLTVVTSIYSTEITSNLKKNYYFKMAKKKLYTSYHEKLFNLEISMLTEITLTIISITLKKSDTLKFLLNEIYISYEKYLNLKL